MIFRKELAEAILRGEKTATRRRMSDKPRSPWWRDECSYSVGQVFSVQPGRGVKGIGFARVSAVYLQRLGHMDEDDAYAEGFRPGRILTSAKQAFAHAWCEINGSYDSAEFVWVIEFEVLEAGRG